MTRDPCLGDFLVCVLKKTFGRFLAQRLSLKGEYCWDTRPRTCCLTSTLQYFSSYPKDEGGRGSPHSLCSGWPIRQTSLASRRVFATKNVLQFVGFVQCASSANSCSESVMKMVVFMCYVCVLTLCSLDKRETIRSPLCAVAKSGRSNTSPIFHPPCRTKLRESTRCCLC